MDMADGSGRRATRRIVDAFEETAWIRKNGLGARNNGEDGVELVFVRLKRVRYDPYGS